MVKFGRVSRARPRGRRVLGRCPFGPRKQGSQGVCLCAVWGAGSGAVEAVWDARWQVLEAVLGHAEAVRAPPLHEKCAC